MSEISITQTAILGLLYEHHHYAHRLEEIMDRRSMRNWADIEYTSIEDVLKQLENEGFIETELIKKEGQPINKIYSITSRGIIVFRDKIKDLMSNREQIKYSFDMGLANIHLLSQKEIIQCLGDNLNSLDERINFMDEMIKFQEENDIPYNFIAIFSRSSALLKAERKWLQEFIKKIQ